MEKVRPRALLCLTAAAVAVAALVAGCANQPSSPAAGAGGAAAGSTSAQAGTGGTGRTTPETPELTPAQAKAEAQKLALQSVDQLQSGDEASARTTLGRALRLSPSLHLA